MNRKRWIELLALFLCLALIHFLGVGSIWAFVVGCFCGIVSEMIDARAKK